MDYSKPFFFIYFRWSFFLKSLPIKAYLELLGSNPEGQLSSGMDMVRKQKSFSTRALTLPCLKILGRSHIPPLPWILCPNQKEHAD